MSNDDDWVEDVRRWYFGGTAPAGDRSNPLSEAFSTYETALGYEAAHPGLRARHWPDAPSADDDLASESSGKNSLSH